MLNSDQPYHKDLSAMRQNYTLNTLALTNTHSDPYQQFNAWLAEAKSNTNILEANAMQLATCGNKSQPTIRTVLLKGIYAPRLKEQHNQQEGFVFYTNYKSHKAEAIAQNSQVALLFFWGALERQVHIVGKAQRLSEAENEAYFHSRPRQSQLGAWASPQSKPIPNRAALERKLDQLKIKYADPKTTIPLPSFWGGYCVYPESFEFWQGRTSRLHDRICYKRDTNNNNWSKYRIAP